MANVRTEVCLGFITGKCIYDGQKPCSQKKKKDCFPPTCPHMDTSQIENCEKIWCKKRQEFVDPWKICLNCNPRS